MNEKALPLDVSKVARLIRMPKSLPAIQGVLDEFFVKSDDGWHNKRADEELTSMLAKQEQQAIKDEHEAERMRRYRERRAMMFAALRAVHVVPAWDVPMKELQRLFDTHCNAPETDLQREQVVSGDAPATAIPTPTPTPTPTPINKEERAPRKRSAPTEVAKPDDVAEQTWTDWLALRKAKKAPVTETVLEQAKRESEKADMPLDAFLQVWCMRGSQGLQADWLKPAERQTASRQPMSYAQHDELARRARWEEMTGRKWPEAGQPADADDYIDITPLQPKLRVAT